MRREKSKSMPILSDLIFNILIPATIVQTARISLSIQAPPLTQYPTKHATPTMNEMISKILTFQNRIYFSFWDFINHNVSAMQMFTPMIPMALPTTFKEIEVTSGIKYAKTDPMMTNALKTIIK